MKKRYLGLLVLALGIVSCHPAEKYYVKEVTFPQGISPEEKNRYSREGCALGGAIRMAANGIDRFCAFWYEHLHRAGVGRR